MAEHQHLPLPSAEINLERRKRSGFPGAPERAPRAHARVITGGINEVVAAHRAIGKVGPIQPSLIMKVETAGYTAETDWSAADISVLSVDTDKTLVVLSSDDQLTTFRDRLEKYSQGPKEGKKTAPYSNLIAPLETISAIKPSERLGKLLKLEGINDVSDFETGTTYSLDVELWEIPAARVRRRQTDDFISLVEELGGEVLDRYMGHTMTLLRVRGPGSVFAKVAEVTDVRQIELPPQVDQGIGEILTMTLGEFPDVPRAAVGGPSITVIDSGVASAHPLLEPALGECIAVPDSLDPNDEWGHGTKVAGVAVYGNLRESADSGAFAPAVTLHSARVLKGDGKFPDDVLVTSQMRDAISYFHETHGCRVFNISLGDPRTLYDGERVSTWAAALDELARDLDIVLVISAGNLNYVGANPESPLADYPGYLLAAQSSIYEPGSAALALTVGSISHAAAVPPDEADRVGLRPIAPVDGPSPFTRCGPEDAACSKPDVCDYGGNLTFDGIGQRVTSTWAPNGILTLNPEYLRRLFTTTIGTSLAAPLVAYKAALLIDAMPGASSNLVRALLASSARVPQSAADVLEPLGPDAVRRVCGAGVPSLERAMYSDDHRVTLFTDTEIDQDQFYVYEIPIVPEFVGTRGVRHISVSLAFDPPVRHTRNDYLGNRMSFRLVRGASLDEVTEFYRKRTKAEGPVPEAEDMRECPLVPSSTRRETSTLQKATFTMKRNTAAYGDTYYLVVRCEGRWAPPSRQRFAVAVTMEHENVDELYLRVAQRVQVRTRARA